MDKNIGKYEINEWQKDKWPIGLKNIKPMAKKLFIRGQEPDPDGIFLTIVGPRRASSYAIDVAKFLIQGLKNMPICLVSGLAFGIDSLVHEMAMQNNLKTIAFPGSGLDDSVLYPQNHLNLAYKILENGGCLISEYSPAEKTRPYFFPQRNRLMAGVSNATLIIEANLKSGSMITARLALDYGKDVLCVPGSIFNPNAEGVNHLINRGATPICSPREIIEILGLEKFLNSENLTLNLSEVEKNILKMIRENYSVGEILNNLKISIETYNQTKTLLELEGFL